MKNTLLIAAALIAMVSGTAMAADMRPPPPVYTKAPPPPPPFTWTGCYFGGNVGGLWAKKDWSIAGTGFAESSDSISSWLAGAQIGCNYQVQQVVFGVQADYDWSNASGSATDSFFINTTDQVTVKSLASVTGRIGYAWDRFMFYGKGGGAWVKDNYTVSAPGFVATASETRTGWTLGVGGEYAFTDWLTGFVEYDYYNFGTKSDSFLPAFALTDIKQTVSVAKGGLNIRFGNWWH